MIGIQGENAVLLGSGALYRELNPLVAIPRAVELTWERTALFLRAFKKLILGEIPRNNLGGPIEIARQSHLALQRGIQDFIQLVVLISINLGILNLLPIPILDGGHITIMALEGLARRDFSVRVKEKMLLAGFVVLMVLMVTVIYNDLTRISWFERLMPWR
jgi:regulator of sigma E protease